MWSAMWWCCKHTVHFQEVLVIHLQSCKTVGVRKVFCTQAPESKMFTMVHRCSQYGGEFQCSQFESVGVSGCRLWVVRDFSQCTCSWQVVSDPAVSFSRGMVNYQDPNMNVECPLCIWRCWELASSWTHRESKCKISTHIYWLYTILVTSSHSLVLLLSGSQPNLRPASLLLLVIWCYLHSVCTFMPQFVRLARRGQSNATPKLPRSPASWSTGTTMILPVKVISPLHTS